MLDRDTREELTERWNQLTAILETHVVTPYLVSEAVRVIADTADDYEVAHSREDALHVAVLTAIAEGRCFGVAECATVAIRSCDIEFARYCA